MPSVKPYTAILGSGLVSIVIIFVIQLLQEKKIMISDFIITEKYNTGLGEDVTKLLIEKTNFNFFPSLIFLNLLT